MLQNYIKQILSLYNYIDAIVMINNNGIIKYSDNFRKDIYNLYDEEIIGKYILDIYPSIDKNSSSLLSVLKNGKAILIDNAAFKDFKVITVDEDEAYSANCIVMNDHLIIPKGFIKSKKALVDAGYKIVEVEMSEFEKMDGGLTCLSLRIPVDSSN